MNIDSLGQSLLLGKIDKAILKGVLNESRKTLSFISHPLGFYRAYLGHHNEGAIYLHAWIPGRSVTQSSDLLIHSHSVDVVSAILHGSLTDCQYNWLEHPHGKNQLFAQNREKTGPRLIRLGRTGDAIAAQTRIIMKNEVYDIPWPAFHQTKVSDSELVVSVAMFVNKSTNVPLIVGPNSDKKIPDYKPLLLSRRDSNEIVNSLSIN